MSRKAYMQAYYRKNRDKLLQRAAEQYDYEGKRAYDKRYNDANAEVKAAQKQAWATENPTRSREIKQAYYRRNKKAVFANMAVRRARVRNACPKWLTKEQMLEMKSIYAQRPDGHHVDHIVPLAGKDVCGLHVPWNLQYLPASDNYKKGNKS